MGGQASIQSLTYNRSDWSIEVKKFFGCYFNSLIWEIWLAYFATVIKMSPGKSVCMYPNYSTTKK